MSTKRNEPMEKPMGEDELKGLESIGCSSRR
jgi:hypothetical protein